MKLEDNIKCLEQIKNQEDGEHSHDDKKNVKLTKHICFIFDGNIEHCLLLWRN